MNGNSGKTVKWQLQNTASKTSICIETIKSFNCIELVLSAANGFSKKSHNIVRVVSLQRLQPVTP